MDEATLIAALRDAAAICDMIDRNRATIEKALVKAGNFGAFPGHGYEPKRDRIRAALRAASGLSGDQI
jgi:hypothetical protein